MPRPYIRKTPPEGGVFSECNRGGLTHATIRVALGHETSLAEDWLSAFLNRTWFERHLAGAATLGAHCIVHFARCATIVFASGAASLTTLGSAQVLAGVKFLFTVGERKYLSAIAARELLISHSRKKERNESQCSSFLISGLTAYGEVVVPYDLKTKVAVRPLYQHNVQCQHKLTYFVK